MLLYYLSIYLISDSPWNHLLSLAGVVRSPQLAPLHPLLCRHSFASSLYLIVHICCFC